MNRRLLILPATIALAGALALAGCSSSSSTPAATGSAPSVAVPTTASVPTLPAAGGSFTIPSFVIPSFNTNADPELAAKFPKTIDGQPVTGIQTFRFIDLLSLPGSSPDVLNQFKTFANQLGIDPNSISIATAQATVGGQPRQISGVRAPGGSATAFIQALATVSQQGGGSPIALTSATVGGKNVQVSNPGDAADYYYPTGDVAFILSNVDPATAATILSALP